MPRAIETKWETMGNRTSLPIMWASTCSEPPKRCSPQCRNSLQTTLATDTASPSVDEQCWNLLPKIRGLHATAMGVRWDYHNGGVMEHTPSKSRFFEYARNNDMREYWGTSALLVMAIFAILIAASNWLTPVSVLVWTCTTCWSRVNTDDDGVMRWWWW